MYYYALIKKEGDDFIVSFPQFEQINTYGRTREEAIKNAEEALNGSIESDFERGFEIPDSQEYKGKNYYRVYIRPHIEIALRLRKIRDKKSQIELAKELGISYQSYQRLENPRRCNPTVKTLERIAKIFNKELEIVLK
ncbi:MAG: type II toxin-antitoxin system HicB family antitoxin [Spirochaetota bacterium]|nr:type II toxin-antitoxin system HicB family antitoxin [Spirochaetota bacterium]